MPLHGHDYVAAKADMLKGLTLREIAIARNIPYEALQKYANRHKWTIDRTSVGHAVSDTITTGLVSRATSWITKVDTLVHASLDNVMSKGLDKLGLRDLSLALDCADKANRIARQTYGLDADNDSKPRVTVNVAVLDRHNATDTQVIDVDTLPVATVVAHDDTLPGVSSLANDNTLPG